MKKAIVFGGSGFLGSHVSDELTKRNFLVTIFDVYKSTYLSGNQKMIIGNILDRDLVMNSIKNQDYVFHFAGIADLSEAKEDPIKSANFNIIGTLNILDACIEYKIKRFVFSSTIYVYSNHGSFYRASKQACELYIENYNKEFNLKYSVLRYGSLYGTRANKFNFISNSIISALKHGKIPRKGNGEEIRAYINIKDAAIATVNSLEESYENKFLMITGEENYQVKEVLNTICEMIGNDVKVEYHKGQKDNGHYKLTPYSFKPNIAKKIQLDEYHELGQGILELLYEIKQDLSENGIKTIYNE